MRAENRVFSGIIKSLLPKVGESVRELHLSKTSALRDSQIKAMLQSCTNIVKLDLSYTKVTFRAFKGLFKYGSLAMLEVLNLEGCVSIDDRVIDHMNKCYSMGKKGVKSALRRLNLSGCKNISSYGLSLMERHQKRLEELDLSGCFMLDGETLSTFVKGCSRLKPDKIWYCNDIEDGPYPQDANGCSNLECSIRFCCRQLKN